MSTKSNQVFLAAIRCLEHPQKPCFAALDVDTGVWGGGCPEALRAAETPPARVDDKNDSTQNPTVFTAPLFTSPLRPDITAACQYTLCVIVHTGKLMILCAGPYGADIVFGVNVVRSMATFLSSSGAGPGVNAS